MSASFCISCGGKHPPLAKFCPNCGNSVDGSIKKAPTSQPKSRVLLASELKRRSKTVDDDENEDGEETEYNGPDSAPNLEKLDVQITIGGKLQGTSDSNYSSRKFSGKDLFDPNAQV